MIRLAKQEDIQAINQLGELLYNNFSTKYNIRDYLQNNNYIILVEESDMINSVLIVYANIDYYEIETVVTSPLKRGKGYATSLFNYLVTNYLHNKDEILLEVAENNRNARNLYNNLGFIEIGRRKKYYGEIDAIIMKKVI